MGVMHSEAFTNSDIVGGVGGFKGVFLLGGGQLAIPKLAISDLERFFISL